MNMHTNAGLMGIEPTNFGSEGTVTTKCANQACQSIFIWAPGPIKLSVPGPTRLLHFQLYGRLWAVVIIYLCDPRARLLTFSITIY